MPPKGHVIDLTGRVFGRLTVLKKTVYDEAKKRTFWLCRCTCGNEVQVDGANLRRGMTKSCGCYRNQRIVEANIKHGGASKKLKVHTLYHIWQGMRNRCYKSDYKNYANYGGRGIKVCKEWMEDFGSFQDWAIRAGWSEGCGLSIDRIDNDGDYCPDNCRWATPFEQSNNRRSNVLVECQGTIRPLAMWVKALHLSYKSIHRCMDKGPDGKYILTVPEDWDADWLIRVYEEQSRKAQRYILQLMPDLGGNKTGSSTIHGESRTRLYHTWQDMKNKCLNKTAKSYIGAELCQEWTEYVPFRDWALAHGYVDNTDLMLYREDTEKGYCPENCRFVTRSEYAKLLLPKIAPKHEYKGESLTVKEWAVRFQRSPVTINKRLKKANYDTAIAFAGLKMKGEE